MPEGEYQKRYRVSITKPAKRAGDKVFAQEKNRLWLIRELQKLRYWPENKDEFECEKAFGAIKLDFYLEEKWIRVFVYEDPDRSTMWIIGVFVKKTNQLTLAQQISVETAVSRLQQEIKQYRKQQKTMEERNRLRVIEGGGRDR